MVYAPLAGCALHSLNGENMNERRIVKVFPESGGFEKWLTRVMCDDGTIWEQDNSKSASEWRCITEDAIPPRAPKAGEGSLFERVFGPSHNF